MSRPVRTLLFSTLFPSSTRPLHGIFVETRLRQLLSYGGVETKVVSPVPWFPSTHPRFGGYAKLAATPASEARYGVEVVHPRYFLPPKVGMTLAPLSMALASIRPIQKIVDEGFDFDLIDAHYFYPDGVAAAILAKWVDRPLSITARGTDLNLIPRYPIQRRMIQWAAGQAQASIGVCKALTDVLRSLGISDSRLHVLRNGVDLERFHPIPPTEARKRIGLEGQPILLSVGHLVERKGHHLVIEALEKLLGAFPGAHLAVVGDGEERNRLSAIVAARGLQGRVTLAGAVSNEDLACWYSAADALVLASSREGWANVLLESMACGTPVVATDIWGTPEIVDATVGVLVKQRSADAIARGIELLLQQAPSRPQVRRYAERFSWEDTSSGQVELFRMITREFKAR